MLWQPPGSADSDVLCVIEWETAAWNLATALIVSPARKTSADWGLCRRGSLLVSISGKQAGQAGPTYGLHSFPSDNRPGCLPTAE